MNKEYISLPGLKCLVCESTPDAQQYDDSVSCILHINDVHIPVCHNHGILTEAQALRGIGITPFPGTPGDPEKCTWSIGCFSHKLGKCLVGDRPEKCENR